MLIIISQWFITTPKIRTYESISKTEVSWLSSIMICLINTFLVIGQNPTMLPQSIVMIE